MFDIEVLEYTDGFFKIRIKRPLGEVEIREFSKAALKEYFESLKVFCRHKGYKICFNHLEGRAYLTSYLFDF